MDLLFVLIPEEYGLLIAASMSFVCAWYVHRRKKQMETDAYRHPNYSSYRIEVLWKDPKKRERIHRCSYAFRKKNCPKEGEGYQLIYSEKYDKVISRDEIRQNRKNCFYCWAMAVFWIIIIGAKVGLY